MGLVHPRLAAPGCCAPVDSPDPVARHERAQVGELDPVAARARHLAAREGLRLPRPDQPSENLAAWVDLQGLDLLDLGLVHEQAERVRRAEHEVADEVGAPALAAQRVVELPALVPLEPDDLRVRRLRLEPVRKVEEKLEPADCVPRPNLEGGADGLALELALSVELEDRADPRSASEGEPQY